MSRGSDGLRTLCALCSPHTSWGILVNTSRRTVRRLGAGRRTELHPLLTAAQAKHQADQGAECRRGQQQRARDDLRRHVEQPIADAAGGRRAAAD
eukprot:scaffold47884_cov69-Phaeocystis_antarctica.AAC.2